MGHTLADLVIDGHERSLGLHHLFYRGGNSLNIAKELRNQVRGEICKGFHMLFRNQQAVSGKQRPMVEESQREVVGKDNVGGRNTVHNLAEQTAFLQAQFHLQAIAGPSGGRCVVV